MSNENVNVEVKEEKCNCFCHSKGFRKFLISALGSFVGVFCALSLFAALHKPPMAPPCPCGCAMMRPSFHQCRHIDKMEQKAIAEYRKQMLKNKLDKKMPVRVDIDIED